MDRKLLFVRLQLKDLAQKNRFLVLLKVHFLGASTDYVSLGTIMKNV